MLCSIASSYSCITGPLRGWDDKAGGYFCCKNSYLLKFGCIPIPLESKYEESKEGRKVMLAPHVACLCSGMMGVLVEGCMQKCCMGVLDAS